MTLGEALGNYRFHPMQCDIHEQRREDPSLSYPRFARGVDAAIHHPRSEPGVNGLPQCWISLQLIQHHRLVHEIERPFNISVEHKGGMTFNRHQNGCYRIMGAPTGTKAVTMSFKLHLPFWFK